jgi:hypothetical protein
MTLRVEQGQGRKDRYTMLPPILHDAVHVRVESQRRAPVVQHQRLADAGTQMLGVAGNRDQHLGGHTLIAWLLLHVSERGTSIVTDTIGRGVRRPLDGL